MRLCYISYENHVHDKRMLAWFSRNSDHEIHLITTKDIAIDGVNVHRLEKSFDNPVVNIAHKAFEVRRLISKINPDILHLHTLYYPSILGVASLFRPLFITPWNGDIAWTGKRKPLHKAIALFALRYADCITTDSEHMEKVCMESYGINENKISRIQWSGVDIDKFRRSDERRTAVRENLGIGKDDVVIISPRSLADIYNIDVIIDAFHRISKDHPELKLIQIWNYSNEDILSSINRKIDVLGLKDRVKMVGKVAHELVADHFAASDIYLSCSSYDTTPTTLLEAMASGCVPVISDLPAIREWVYDGVNGFIVDPKDPISVSNGIERALNSDRGYLSSLNEQVVKTADYDMNMRVLERLYEKHT